MEAASKYSLIVAADVSRLTFSRVLHEIGADSSRYAGLLQSLMMSPAFHF
jgi:hypothetical protein